MATFLAALIVMLLAAAGLGLGWLVRGRALRGTCASLSGLRDEPCPVCGGRPSSCPQDGAS